MFMCQARPYKSRKPTSSRRVTGLAMALLMVVLAVGGFARDAHSRVFCSTTAAFLLKACANQVRDDFWATKAGCINIRKERAGRRCRRLAQSEREEGFEDCDDQNAARLELCGDLGEARYDPRFKPARFVDPLKIGLSVDPNPYFPLEQGREWVYEGGGETITVTVTTQTKLIGGVTCLVVNDTVVEDGVVTEDTDDWYAQDLDGNVWYCGEISLEFELQKGEAISELVGIEGSWKALRDLAEPGILMKAVPQVGDVYRQELALGDAEDAAEVLSVTASATAPAASCANDCVKTRDFSPLEPDALERKFYAPGIGLILEVDQETGERVELVSMTP